MGPTSRWLLEDVTCDRALPWCEVSAAGGGFGAWESVEEMKAIEGHGVCVGEDGVWIRLVLACVSWSVQTHWWRQGPLTPLCKPREAIRQNPLNCHVQ